MSKLLDYNPTTEALAASGTTSHSKGVPMGGLRRLFTETTGANNGLNTGTVGIDSIRVKTTRFNTIWDATTLMQRTLLESLTPDNFTPSTELRWPVPLDLDGVGGYDPRIGVPLGDSLTYEIITNANGSAGLSTLSWMLTPKAAGIPDGVDAMWLPRFVQFASGQAASTNKNRKDLIAGDREFVYGVYVPVLASAGISRFKLVLEGVEICELDKLTLLAYATSYSPCSIATAVYFRLPPEYIGKLRATKGNSYIETDTGASAAASDPFALYTLEKVA